MVQFYLFWRDLSRALFWALEAAAHTHTKKQIKMTRSDQKSMADKTAVTVKTRTSTINRHGAKERQHSRRRRNAGEMPHKKQISLDQVPKIQQGGGQVGFKGKEFQARLRAQLKKLCRRSLPATLSKDLICFELGAAMGVPHFF